MEYTTLPEPFFVEMELRNIGFNPFNPDDTMSFAYMTTKDPGDLKWIFEEND